MRQAQHLSRREDISKLAGVEVDLTTVRPGETRLAHHEKQPARLVVCANVGGTLAKYRRLTLVVD